MWLRDVSGEDPPVAGVIAVRDEKAAEAALPKLQDDGERGTYEGVNYVMDDEDTAAGLVDGYLVVGDLPVFKEVVDARDGDHLADSERYKDVIGELEDDRLGLFYLDTQALIDAAVKADPAAAAQLQQVRSFLPDRQARADAPARSPPTATASRSTRSLTDVPDGPLRRLASLFAGGESDLLTEMPGDAWGALALPGRGRGRARARQLLRRADRRRGAQRAGQALDRPRPRGRRLLVARRHRRLRARHERGRAGRRPRRSSPPTTTARPPRSASSSA